MKPILAVIALVACSLVAQAQTTTNIAWRVTVETVVAGVTNSVNTNFRWDASVKKDALKIDGMAYYFGKYVQGGGTDTFGVWLRTDVNDRGKSYADAKQAVDNAALGATINLILTTQSDLLTVAEKNQLIAIAAKLTP